jgi:hypothetical protein
MIEPEKSAQESFLRDGYFRCVVAIHNKDVYGPFGDSYPAFKFCISKGENFSNNVEIKTLYYFQTNFR